MATSTSSATASPCCSRGHRRRIRLGNGSQPPFERTEARTNQHSGSRDHTLSTKAGDFELKIPRIDKGGFFPSILERRRPIDQAIYAAVIEVYVHGVSTRKVDDLVQALGLDSGISKSEVSRICTLMDKDLESFRTRDLSHVEFPYVFLDTTYLKCRVSRHVTSRAHTLSARRQADEPAIRPPTK